MFAVAQFEQVPSGLARTLLLVHVNDGVGRERVGVHDDERQAGRQLQLVRRVRPRPT